MGLLKSTGKALDTRLSLLLALIVTAAVIESFGDTGRELLRFERQRILDGEFWRLVTGHFAHLAPQHLALNALGLGIVALLVGRALCPREWLLAFIVCLASTSAGLLFLDPELNWYVGLSGVLHGLLVTGLLANLPLRRTESAVLLAIVVAKIGWEQFVGPMPGAEGTAGGPVIVNAHLYGAIGGGLATAILISARRRTQI